MSYITWSTGMLKGISILKENLTDLKFIFSTNPSTPKSHGRYFCSEMPVLSLGERNACISGMASSQSGQSVHDE